LTNRIYVPNASTLLYGGPGSGKTALAVSSFWDWRKREPVANGKLITFGGEDNPALMVPQSMRETAKGTSLRLISPLLDSQAFLNQFSAIVRRFVADAEEGHPLDVLVIDSLTEFDLMFESTFVDTGEKESQFAKWNALLSEMFALLTRASHTALDCQVIMTARVMEKKRAKQTKQGSSGGDPDYMDFDYYPSMRGSFRLHLPHYFNLVLYQDTGLGRTSDGKVVPAHKTHMVRDGDYYVKNVFEHEWLANESQSYVVNAMWPDLWSRMTRAITNYVPQEAEEITEIADTI
jgi:AAA domain